MYAEIALQQKIGNQETLTYKVPVSLRETLKQGHLVEITLKRRTTTGIVWSLHKKQPNFLTVDIKSIISPKQILQPEQIALANWISQYYFAPLFKVLKLFVPTRIFKNKLMKPRTKEKAIPEYIALKKLTIGQQKALDLIEQNNSSETDSQTPPLNKFLIHGITGSGKTEIYLHLAKKHLDQGRQVLILVPEISLTPQTVEYFESRLQIKAAVIHSKLSEGEKYKTWHDIHTEKKNLVIGSRSSIFSPFKELALIIMDEEHEFSYKQDQSPRYLTHSVAEKIQELFPSKPTLVLGSATPSIETTFKYKDITIELQDRIGKAKLPTVEIVDMRQEFHKANKSIFSEVLQSKIRASLSKGKQIILFLNRRGSASSIVCRDCGLKLECENCDIPMTYHARTLGRPVTICHHCGAIGKIPINCPGCKSLHIRYLGIGTERIEEETKKLFKEARVLRADKDTTSRKNSFEQIYSSFKKGEADILIGTQMIGKGLHLPNVNLVGVILADIGLNIPDFRSSERTFQVLTQVAGRAGRSEEPGEVVIQTYSPDNFALQAAEKHDYKSFYNLEREQRKILSYPPFSRLAQITFVNVSYNKAKEQAERTEAALKKLINTQCYPAFITRLHGKYRYRVLLKGDHPEKAIKQIDKKLLEEARIDIDPIHTG